MRAGVDGRAVWAGVAGLSSVRLRGKTKLKPKKTRGRGVETKARQDKTRPKHAKTKLGQEQTQNNKDHKNKT
jgi:hypothetical protein